MKPHIYLTDQDAFYIAEDNPNNVGNPYMRVKPCPECDGSGRVEQTESTIKATCKCKDGWVIA